MSAAVTLAFAVSLFIDIRAKPHQFPLVELDWHFGNPSVQERFKSSHLRSKSNTAQLLTKNGSRKTKVEELAEKGETMSNKIERKMEQKKGTAGKGE